MVRKFFHPGDPRKKIEKGKPGYDNLSQIAPSRRLQHPHHRAARDRTGDTRARANGWQ